ncbi:MAG: NADH-quinone oxidoreductase subunit J, partial [Planctomycetota bacterium]
GGTMVLLVFGVMLTGKGPFISMGTGGGQWILATLIGGSLLAILLPTAFGLPGPATTRERATSAEVGAAATAPTSDALGLALIGVRADKAAETGSRRDGLAGYLLPFEIVSVHLLVVLVGAAYLARARRRRQTPTSHTVASMADFKEPTA